MLYKYCHLSYNNFSPNSPRNYR